MKIYTRTGDQGTTSLIGGTRVPKQESRIEAYGTVDELMAHTGYLHDLLTPQPPVGQGMSPAQRHAEEQEQLEWVLDRLMTCASLLAAEAAMLPQLPPLSGADVTRLEGYIDGLQEGLPELRHFTLPCGSPVLSYSHVCRTVCRRAERRILAAVEIHPEVPEPVLTFVNRLSDYFYALGRRLGDDLGARDVRWEPKK